MVRVCKSLSPRPPRATFDLIRPYSFFLTYLSVLSLNWSWGFYLSPLFIGDISRYLDIATLHTHSIDYYNF